MSGPHGWSNAQHIYSPAYQQQIRSIQSNTRTSSGIVFFFILKIFLI